MNIINRNLQRTTALVFMLAAGAGLAAQEMGALSGIVRDNAGNPVAGAIVEITSPTMLGARPVTTNAQGRYNAPLLPPGNYRAVVRAQGFRVQVVDNIRVSVGAGTPQNFTLVSITEQVEVIEITGTTAGQIDKSDTGARHTFSSELLNMLPVGRSFGGAATLSPGIVTGSSGQLVVRGGQGQQTQYRVDGADVKNDYQGVLIRMNVVEDNIEDAQAVLSETHARFGRSTGGSLNVVTKSGSNAFSGSIRANINRNAWQGMTEFTTGRQDAQGTMPFNDHLTKNFEWTLNGPIWKDRVWFAASGLLYPNNRYQTTISTTLWGTNANVVNQNINGYTYMGGPAHAPGLGGTGNWTDSNDPVNTVLNQGPGGGYLFPGAVNPATGRRGFDAGQQYFTTDDMGRYDVKITAMPVQNHTFELQYVYVYDNILNRAPGGAAVWRLSDTESDQEVTNHTYNVAYRGIITDNLFLEAKYSKRDNTIFWGVRDMSLFPDGLLMFVQAGQRDGRTTNVWANSTPSGGGYHPDRQIERSNRSGNLNFKWITDFFNANHELDFGVDYYMGKLFEATSYMRRDPHQYGASIQMGGMYENQSVNGPNRYLYPVSNYVYNPAMDGSLHGSNQSGSIGPHSAFLQWIGDEGILTTPMFGYYLNDKFTINNHWNGSIGLRYETSKVEDWHGRVVADSAFFSPRLQLTYDIKGDSSHVMRFSAARFGTDFNVRFAETLVNLTDSKGLWWAWTANPYNPYTPGDIVDGREMYGVRFVTYNQLTDINNYKFNINLRDNEAGKRVDPNLSVPYMDEFTLGYRRQWMNGSYVNFTYVNRTWYDEWAFATDYTVNDFALLDPANYQQHIINGGELFPLYQQISRVFNAGSELKRDYQGFEMDFNARINRYWSVMGNWTISRLTANDDGGESGSSFGDYATTKPYYGYQVVQETRGITRDMVSPYGRHFNDQTHRGRLAGLLQLPLGKGYISFSALLYYESARPGALTHPFSYPGGIARLMRPDGRTDIDNGEIRLAPPGSWTGYWNNERAWLQGNDDYRTDLNIAWSIPMGLPGFASNLQFFGNIYIYRLFNERINANGFHTTTDAGVYGSVANRLFQWTAYPNAYKFGTQDLRNGSNFWRSPRYMTASFGLRF